MRNITKGLMLTCILLSFLLLVNSCSKAPKNGLTVMGKELNTYKTSDTSVSTTVDVLEEDLIVEIEDESTPTFIISDVMTEDQLISNLSLETDLILEPEDITKDEINKTLNIDFVIHNGSDYDLSLLYGTSQTFDYSVSTRTNQVIYSFSDKKDFTNQITEIAIPSQSDYYFNIQYDYKDNNGLSLEPGSYTITFYTEFRLYNKKILLSQTEAFQIVEY